MNKQIKRTRMRITRLIRQKGSIKIDTTPDPLGPLMK